MTRQQIRNAKRRISKRKTPFPEFNNVLRKHLMNHPEVFIQCNSYNEIKTNLSGETQTFDLSGFYNLLQGIQCENSPKRTF